MIGGETSEVGVKFMERKMAFFKRTIAKRFDLLFRRKRRGKFVECVHKVIEARRSGCIDEDGNILKPLTEMLAAHDKQLQRESGNTTPHHHRESPSEEALKVGPTPTGNGHRRLARQHVVSIRDSYPLPEEDDGSEGYASAGETDDSFNPTAFLERNRRSSRRISTNSEEGHINRRVRFSDEVQHFGGLDSEDEEPPPTTAPDSQQPEEPPEDPDLSTMSLAEKIKYFERVVDRLEQKRKNNHPETTAATPNDQPSSTCPGSPEIRHRVKLFEDISKGIPIEPPPSKPRRAVQSCQYTQTKSKINFFEQLSHEC